MAKQAQAIGKESSDRDFRKREQRSIRAFCEIYSQMRKRKTFETTVDIEEFGRIQEASAGIAAHARFDLSGQGRPSGRSCCLRRWAIPLFTCWAPPATPD